MATEEKPTDQELSELDQGSIYEEFPTPVKIDTEEILNTNRNHNAWIIIGRDRPAGKQSGYGRFDKKNLGDKCTTLDICVGRYSSDSEKGDYNRAFYVGNNIQKDASRIYISQKTDIDNNFLIEKAGTLVPAIGKAAIGIKSDNLRFVARESIKIVANSGDVNSLGKRESSVRPIYGIQLICGSETESNDVQGLVKSENLRECLEDILTMIDDCFNTLYNFILFQREFNDAIASHTHIGHLNPSPAGSVNIVEPFQLLGKKSKFDAQVDSKVLTTISSNRADRKNNISTTYLNKPANAKKYIGSMYNKTN